MVVDTVSTKSVPKVAENADFRQSDYRYCPFVTTLIMLSPMMVCQSTLTVLIGPVGIDR